MATRKTRKAVTPEQREYAKIRSRSHAENNKEFDRRVLAYMEKKKLQRTPENFLLVAKCVSIPCRRCAQTGRFITGSLNGQPTGPGGICYRCEGKGWQDDSDARRNYGADVNQIVRNA